MGMRIEIQFPRQPCNFQLRRSKVKRMAA